jgi:hypothetical protein
MQGPYAFPVDFTSTGPVKNGTAPVRIVVGTEDKLYYSFEGETITTGVLQVFTKRSTSETFGVGTTLTVDGTANSVDISGAYIIEFQVTTAESGKTGTLSFFTRKDQE